VGDPRPKKQRLLQQVLDTSMLPRVHPDEGKVARDFNPLMYETRVTRERARENIEAAQDQAIETSVLNQQFGRRTFPPVAGSYAAPTYMDNNEVQQRVQRKQRSIAQPFYTDPGSGEVDFNQVPHPYVFAVESGYSGATRERDYAEYPAAINKHAFSGNRKDPYTSMHIAEKEAIRPDLVLEWMKSNPVKATAAEALKFVMKLLDRPSGRNRKK